MSSEQTKLEFESGYALPLNPPDPRVRLLIGAWVGTALAGGVFGVLLFCWEVVLPINDPTSFGSIGSVVAGVGLLLAGSVASFVGGALFAGWVGIGGLLGGITIIELLGIQKAPLWIASCFGGWIAFFCCGGFVWVAVILGQLGATWGASKMIVTTSRPAMEARTECGNRFGLGQLFRFMTVACVCLGVVSVLPLSDVYLTQMGYCLAWQCVSVTIVLGIREIWQRYSRLAETGTARDAGELLDG